MEKYTAVDIQTRKIGAVLNTASGSCTGESADEMRALFEEYGITPVHIWCGESDELQQAFEEVKKRDLDVLVVLGGDGTIRSAAELCTPEGPLLIPLPGGTMNVLPKALYGNGSWQDILRTIFKAPVIKRISGGEVAGHRFYITAICGAPALWAKSREALRSFDVAEALKHGKVAAEHMFADKVQYSFNEMHEGEAEAITITCPLVADTLKDSRQAFEAAVIDVNDAGAVLEIATAAAFGQWREAKHVSVVTTKTVTVRSEQDIPVIVDGETIDVGREATVEFIPDAFCALIPTPVS